MTDPDNCPICGSEVSFYPKIEKYPKRYIVCMECGFGYLRDFNYENKEASAKSWNQLVKKVKENLRKNYGR